MVDSGRVGVASAWSGSGGGRGEVKAGKRDCRGEYAKINRGSRTKDNEDKRNKASKSRNDETMIEKR